MSLFGSDLKTRLRRIDQQVEQATDRFVATHLVRAAQLCDAAGERDGALRYYGRAVDAYLTSGRGRAAEVICQRIIELKPDVVRAHRTLLLIHLGRGNRAGVEREIEAYVAAARAAGETELAQRQLCLMARVTQDEALRVVLRDACRSLGGTPDEVDPERAIPLLDSAAGSWANAVRLALITPAQLHALVAEQAS